MKKIMKLAIISAFVALGINVASASTNVVLTTSVALTGFKQVDESTAAAVKITNKDIFADLNSGGNFSLGRGSQLVLVSQDGNSPVFLVREKAGGTVNDTDISGVLTISESDEVVSKNVRYAIVTFNFDDGAGNSFSVSGFATLKHGRINGRVTGMLDDRVLSAAVQVSGTGTVGGDFAVFRGTINASGAKTEVQE